MPSKEPRRRDVNAGVRAAKAMQLRVLGHTFTQIATECGYADRGAAYNAVKRELARTMQQPADDLRAVEAERLDALTRVFLAKALRGDHGAADRVLRIMDRRARLLGLDVQPESGTTAAAQVIIREYPVGVADAV